MVADLQESIFMIQDEQHGLAISVRIKVCAILTRFDRWWHGKTTHWTGSHLQVHWNGTNGGLRPDSIRKPIARILVHNIRMCVGNW